MKTKHIFITLFAMLAAFLATACTDKDSLTGTEAPGSTRTLSFNLTTDAQAQTRAASATPPAVTGHKVQYILQVLNADGSNYGSQETNETGQFEVELPVGVEYTCLFWAQYIPNAGSESEYFTTADLKAVALKDVLTADDKCQAFCATATVTTQQAAATNTVILKRAVAQVNLRSNEDLKYYDKIEATYSAVPNTFNVKDNTVSTSGSAGVPSTFTITNTTISPDAGDNKFTFHSVYFLAQGDGNANLLNIELKTYNAGESTPIQTLSVPNVPTKKNYKTNVTATLNAASFTHNFTFDFAEWETEELEPDRASVWDGVTPAADSGYTFGAGSGDGSSASTPYIIADAADFAQLMANVNGGTDYDGKYFKLTTDINLNNHEWTPIGSESKPFKGTFDGDHHRIKGLKINSAGKYVGMFGYIDSGDLSNLHVSGEVVGTDTSDASLDNASAVGGICGISTGSISNCSFAGKVEGAVAAGGIVGYAYNYSGILKCLKNSGSVRGYYSAGGIVGITKTPMAGCYNEGVIVNIGGTFSYGENAGGIAGKTSDVMFSIKACYNIGTVSNTGIPNDAAAISEEQASSGNFYVKEKYNKTVNNEKVFGSGEWPTDADGWAINKAAAGAEPNGYWKSLGNWNNGVNPEYPKLWWEK